MPNPQLQNLVNLYDNAEDIYKSIGKMQKMFFECSVPNGYQIDNIIEDIVNIIKDGKKFSEYISDPNKVTCLASALLGIGIFIKDNIDDIKLDIGTYSKNLIPMLGQIFKDITREFSFSELNVAFEKRLEELTSAAMDIGLGFIQGQVQEKLSDLEQRVYQGIAQFGRLIAFLMTVSGEFRWAMYMLMLNNCKKQINDRINKLIDLRNLIRKLVYEISENNESYTPDALKLTLGNYNRALQLLEDNFPLTKQIEKKLLFHSKFLMLQNDQLINTFGKAKKLLIKERNEFLERILQDPEVNFDPSISKYVFMLSSNYGGLGLEGGGGYSNVKLISNNSKETIDNFMFLDNLKNLNNILLEKKTTKKVKVSLSTPSSVISTPNVIWIRVDNSTDIKTGETILISDNFFKVLSVVDKSVIKRTPTGEAETFYQLLKIKYIFEDTYIKKTRKQLKNKNIVRYISFSDSDFSFEHRDVIFTIRDDGYTVKKTKIPETEKNTIIIFDSGNSKIVKDWGNSKDWKMLFLLEYEIPGKLPKKSGTSRTITLPPPTIEHKFLEIDGGYTNFVEKEDERVEQAMSELPEPFKSLYKEYKQYKGKKLDINDWFKIGGTLTSYVFGNDLVSGTLDKFGVTKLNYSKYLETATNVLQAFCPLKNSVLSFYSLIDSLAHVPEKEEGMAVKVTRDWLLHLNRLMMGTIYTMTERDPQGHFATVQEIKDSPYYYKLIPSVLADYDNLINLEGIANFSKGLGRGLNANTELDKKFKELLDLTTWLSGGFLDELQDAELNMWNTMSSAFITSMTLMLKGERVSVIRPHMLNMEKRIVNLVYNLRTLHYKIAVISKDPFKSQNEFIKLLEESGVAHWVEYIKNGNFDKFLSEKPQEWVGKYGEGIACLTSILDSFNGMDKKLIQSMINHLTYVDIGELTTNFELGKLDVNHSINLNLFTGTPKSTMINIRKAIDNVVMGTKTTKIITDKKL